MDADMPVNPVPTTLDVGGTMWATALAILLLGSPDSTASGSVRVWVAEGETLRVALRGSVGGRPVAIIPGLFGAVEGFARLSDSLARQDIE